MMWRRYGTVKWRNSSQPRAPSIRMASRCAAGMAVSPAVNIKTKKGVCDQTLATITAAGARFASDNHASRCWITCRCRSRRFATPTSWSNM